MKPREGLFGRTEINEHKELQMSRGRRRRVRLLGTQQSGASATPPLDPSRGTLAAYNQLRTHLTEAAQHSRSLFMTHLAVQGYSLIVLGGLNDKMFFQPNTQQKLPIIDASVSLGWFMPALAAISMFVFAYWQIYQRKMWRIANCVHDAAAAHRNDPAFVPPGGEYRYPWIALFTIHDDSVFRFGAVAFGICEWGLMPLVQWACMLRSLRLGGTLKQWASGIPWGPAFGGLFVLSVGLSLWLWRKQRDLSCRLPDQPMSEWRPASMTIAVTVVGALLWQSFVRNRDHPTQLMYLRARNANLQGMHLARADLRGAHLEHAHLEGAVLAKAILEGAHLESAHFEHADLRGAHLEHAHLDWAVFDDAHLEDALLLASEGHHAHFTHAHLERADLRHTHIEYASMSGAHLERADFGSAHLEGAWFPDAHMERACLGAAKLSGASLERAHLDGADASGAHFERAEIVNPNHNVASSKSIALRPAMLMGARLVGADLTAADLRGADLHGADLTRTRLGEVGPGRQQDEYTARLEGANLPGARLEGARLFGTQLKAAGSLQGAIYDNQTQFPAGFDPLAFQMEPTVCAEDLMASSAEFERRRPWPYTDACTR